MNLYEFEGKALFQKHGIAVPRGIVISLGEDIVRALDDLRVSVQGEPVSGWVVKAQVLSGKRGKNNGIRFVGNVQDAEHVVEELFDMQIKGQHVAAVRVEEKLDIAEEHYLSITYDTNAKQPVLVYSKQGGVDIEDVSEEQIEKILLDVRQSVIASSEQSAERSNPDGKHDEDGIAASLPSGAPRDDRLNDIFQKLWNCFLAEDARLVEINPLVKTTDGAWIAADAKVALDDDAFYRHSADAQKRAAEKGTDPESITNWENYAPRTMMGRPPTDREIAVKKIDEGEGYYRGTAGKYIEMDGDIAILFSGGGASIANMDALMSEGLSPANYTEYSGNPPREKVAALAKVVLSKPNLKGLWIAGGVANFTNVKETFQGIVDALDEVKPAYPIVVRRAGPYEAEGMQLMKDCAERNNLNIKLFGKDVSMSETAGVLAEMIRSMPATQKDVELNTLKKYLRNSGLNFDSSLVGRDIVEPTDIRYDRINYQITEGDQSFTERRRKAIAQNGSYVGIHNIQNLHRELVVKALKKKSLSSDPHTVLLIDVFRKGPYEWKEIEEKFHSIVSEEPALKGKWKEIIIVFPEKNIRIF